MLIKQACIGFLAMALIVASGCSVIKPSSGRTVRNMKIPGSPGDICPILIGQSLPKTVLRTPDNTLFDLNAASAAKPTVLIFYRGGWCPYCSLHLAQLQSIEPDLVKLGFQIIAVSPDRPEVLKKHAEEQGLQYRLLSDSEMTAAISLGVAFKLNDATVRKYKTSYGIDIESDSGHKHHLLPVPSVFVMGKDGVIQFAYVNPDYKSRIDSGVLLKVAEAIIARSAVSKP